MSNYHQVFYMRKADGTIFSENVLIGPRRRFGKELLTMVTFANGTSQYMDDESIDKFGDENHFKESAHVSI